MTEKSRPNLGEEPSSQPERIQLGERFKLFEPRRTLIKPSALQLDEGEGHPMSRVTHHGEEGQYGKSQIVIPLGGIDLTLNIVARMNPEDISLSFVPFSDPYIGYNVTHADFNLADRQTKTDQLLDHEEWQTETDLEASSKRSLQHPLTFEVSSEGELSPRLNLIVPRLRLQVSAANLQFEAGYHRVAYEAGILNFMSFYPTETGPFAVTGDPERDEENGIWLQLPADADKLATITARFHLLTDRELAFEKSRSQH